MSSLIWPGIERDGRLPGPGRLWRL